MRTSKGVRIALCLLATTVLCALGIWFIWFDPPQTGNWFLDSLGALWFVKIMFCIAVVILVRIMADWAWRRGE